MATVSAPNEGAYAVHTTAPLAAVAAFSKIFKKFCRTQTSTDSSILSHATHRCRRRSSRSRFGLCAVAGGWHRRVHQEDSSSNPAGGAGRPRLHLHRRFQRCERPHRSSRAGAGSRPAVGQRFCRRSGNTLRQVRRLPSQRRVWRLQIHGPKLAHLLPNRHSGQLCNARAK